MLPWSRDHALYLLALAGRVPAPERPEILESLIDCGFVHMVSGKPRLTAPAGLARVRELERAMYRRRGPLTAAG